jgi:hypothetical protein
MESIYKYLMELGWMPLINITIVYPGEGTIPMNLISKKDLKEDSGLMQWAFNKYRKNYQESALMVKGGPLPGTLCPPTPPPLAPMGQPTPPKPMNNKNMIKINLQLRRTINVTGIHQAVDRKGGGYHQGGWFRGFLGCPQFLQDGAGCLGQQSCVFRAAMPLPRIWAGGLPMPGERKILERKPKSHEPS